ncbi:MAG: defective in fruiting DifE [Myxococcota bacterium]
MSTPTGDRRLFVFFEAGKTRYAIEAVGVLEVARPPADADTLHGHLALKDLSVLLGGEPEVRPATALVLDTSPTLAVRVRAVEGVFDAAADRALALPRRMIPLAAPALRGGLLHEGRLSFEVDTDGVARGLPRSTRRPERTTREPQEACLVFETGTERLAVPLSRVRQVVPAGAAFNPAPGTGAFLGAVVHGASLCPVFSVSDTTAPESLIVLAEAGGEVIGLSARRADGVQQPATLSAIPVLDLERMFS